MKHQIIGKICWYDACLLLDSPWPNEGVVFVTSDCLCVFVSLYIVS